MRGQRRERARKPARNTKRETRDVVIDIELTLNRFGFGRPADNKVQVGCLRVAWWRIAGKHAISFEVNWRTR